MFNVITSQTLNNLDNLNDRILYKLKSSFQINYDVSICLFCCDSDSSSFLVSADF